MKEQPLTWETFNLTIRAGTQPALVDFWAEWCRPCKMIVPILDELAAEEGDKATVAKVNIDEPPELAARSGITSIPMLMVFKNRRPVRTMCGVRSMSDLVSSLAAAA